MNERDYIVYGLADPRTHDLRYVGKSTIGLRRAAQHDDPYRMARDTNKKKVNWIKELQKQGLKPVLVIIEICELEKLYAAEQRWIAEYRSTGLLFNLDGGPGTQGCIYSISEKGILKPPLIAHRKLRDVLERQYEKRRLLA